MPAAPARPRGGRPLGEVALAGRLLQQTGQEADDRAAEDEQEDVAVDLLREVPPDGEVGDRHHDRRDQPSGPAPQDGPGQHDPHHPEAGQGRVHRLSLDVRRESDRHDRDQEVRNQQHRRPPTRSGVRPHHEHRPQGQEGHHPGADAWVVVARGAHDVDRYGIREYGEPQHGQRTEHRVLHRTVRLDTRAHRDHLVRKPSRPEGVRPLARRCPCRPSSAPPWPPRSTCRRTPGRRAA